MHFRHLLVLLAALQPSCSAVSMRQDDILNRSRELNQKLTVLDTHLDTPSRALNLPDWALHEKSEETLVDLLVCREQQHLATGIREIPLDEQLAVAAVESTKRCVDDRWQTTPGHTGKTPQQ